MPSESNLGEANREQSKSDLPRRRGSGSDAVDDEGVETRLQSTENRAKITDNRVQSKQEFSQLGCICYSKEVFTLRSFRCSSNTVLSINKL